jgi:predicted ATPase/class 3 adenylate cyclase
MTLDMAEAKRSASSRLRELRLPSGLVAFLFTDIEGSTQRWDKHRDAMDAAVKRHDAIVRNAIEGNAGYVFKTVGDAFCAAFAAATDAVSAAIEIQRDLASADFSAVDGVRVRIGLHIGEASERDGDYFGPAVNRAARLMSIGHGGQVLLSGRMRESASSVLPKDASLVDLGLRRLKDLTEPEHVWQLDVAGYQTNFPPLSSLDARPNNLPVQLTRLIGRDQDVEELRSLVAKHRLVTLLGSGGVGKTRLALQAAADLIDHYPDGVWFADLAPISDPELVASVAARTLGMSQGQDRRVDEAIVEWLKRKKLVLVLDNCEHLVETASRLAEAIMRGCPGVHILATSRQALGIDGEVVHRLPSLTVPVSAAGLQAGEAQQFGAIALFVERASSADTRFSLTDDSAPIVADICSRLDGIPLAIELAAARVKVLTISNLARRLDDRFKLLTGGSRTALPRQKTLTALIDWSYDLLDTQEQTLLARVAIFAGGFGLEAATSICADQIIDEADILDLLSSLTDKSLIVADTSGENERYRLLESTRAYALAKLQESGDRAYVAARHAGYFKKLAEMADQTYTTVPSPLSLTRLEVERYNFRAALEWAITDENDVPLGAVIAGSLERLWTNGGLMAEGRYWIVRAQAHLDESTHTEQAARLWLALAGIFHARPKRDCAGRALALFEKLGDRRRAAWSRFYSAFALHQMGQTDESERECELALAASRDCGNARGIASCLNLRGLFYRSPGHDAVEAHSFFAQALEIFKSLGDENGAAVVLGNIAELEFFEGNIEGAKTMAKQAREITSRLHNMFYLAINNTNLAAYGIADGDYDAALPAAREGLKCALQEQHVLGVAIVLQHFAHLAAMRGDAHSAARLLGYVNASLLALGYEREYTEKWGLEKLMVALREQLTDAEIETLAIEGSTWADDRAVEFAMSM